MFKRIMFVFAALLAGLAFTAAPASAAMTSTGPQAGYEQVDTREGAEASATCKYRVNHSGGIRIYAKADHSSEVKGSLANGATFNATCDNVTGGKYPECGANNLWKFVGNGYVKTKCLVRI